MLAYLGISGARTAPGGGSSPQRANVTGGAPMSSDPPLVPASVDVPVASPVDVLVASLAGPLSVPTKVLAPVVGPGSPLSPVPVGALTSVVAAPLLLLPPRVSPPAELSPQAAQSRPKSTGAGHRVTILMRTIPRSQIGAGVVKALAGP